MKTKTLRLLSTISVIAVAEIAGAQSSRSKAQALYSRICELDLQGIVAKHKDSPYLSETTISTWYKIRNPRYSQMMGRHELFDCERNTEPVPGWHVRPSLWELDDAKL